jgi:phage terminase large subunit-like protein
VFDEIGTTKSRAVWDAVATQSAKRAQPLILSISTCGDAVTGLGRQLYDAAVSVLEGQTQDERFFALMFSADESDDPWSEVTWQKANPGWGVTVHPEGMRDLAAQARANPTDQAAFLSRNLNLWQSAGAYSLYSAVDWARCYDPGLTWRERKGERCYLGADLAFRDDLCSLTAVFFDAEDDPASNVAVFSWSFLPSVVITDKSAAQPMLTAWQDGGWLTGTEGTYTDLSVLTDKVAEIAEHADVAGLACDPWHAALWMQLLKERLPYTPIMEYRQSVLNMSLPAKLLGELIAARRIYHDGNPVLAWCVANVVSREDGRGNLLPRKATSDRKIDACVALIMALGLGANAALRNKLDGPIYRDRDLLVW